MIVPTPTEVTVAELAVILGLPELRVAALQAEGRFPMSATGRVLLSELLSGLYAEAASRRSRDTQHVPKPPPRAPWNERQRTSL